MQSTRVFIFIQKSDDFLIYRRLKCPIIYKKIDATGAHVYCKMSILLSIQLIILLMLSKLLVLSFFSKFLEAVIDQSSIPNQFKRIERASIRTFKTAFRSTIVLTGRINDEKIAHIIIRKKPQGQIYHDQLLVRYINYK